MQKTVLIENYSAIKGNYRFFPDEGKIEGFDAFQE